MKPVLGSPGFYSGTGLAVDFPPSHGFALVVQLFPFREGQQDFDASFVEVELERHQRQAFLGRSSNELTNLMTMEKQFALT